MVVIKYIQKITAFIILLDLHNLIVILYYIIIQNSIRYSK